MTDEIKEVKKEEVKKEDQPSEVEAKAALMGWRPEDTWTGSKEEFIDAAEFVRRKPLFDKIESQKNFYDRKLRDVEVTLNQLANHHAKVREVEYQRALTDLRQSKRAALKEGETAIALELEDKMDALNTARQGEIAEQHRVEQEAQNQRAAQPTPEFLTWVQTNDWYAKDVEMRDFADGAAISYEKRIVSQTGRPPAPNEIFAYVVDKVKKAYPEKFENPNRDRPGNVTSGDRGGKGSPKTPGKLPQEYEDIARNFEKSGVMKRDEYIRQLTEMGVI